MSSFNSTLTDSEFPSALVLVLFRFLNSEDARSTVVNQASVFVRTEEKSFLRGLNDFIGPCNLTLKNNYK
ncbi:hypothetical protein CHS0354_020643 [Potamilus streckersoni]|uniref:Uncharacterized protein n=1 Tax=Potamilus streckersoni TaxID=2493646 RepID=A0AAE0W710_9BIVA|nr:hypothetical protein CHS0354_020643 [Potamilus streckersoni]